MNSLATKPLAQLATALSAFALLLTLVSASDARAQSAVVDHYAAARNRMVETRIEAAGVSDPRILRVMRETPRHEFVPPPSAVKRTSTWPCRSAKRKRSAARSRWRG